MTPNIALTQLQLIGLYSVIQNAAAALGGLEKTEHENKELIRKLIDIYNIGMSLNNLIETYKNRHLT